jgi:hypothetical protein
MMVLTLACRSNHLKSIRLWILRKRHVQLIKHVCGVMMGGGQTLLYSGCVGELIDGCTRARAH